MKTEVHPSQSFRFMGLVSDTGLNFNNHIQTRTQTLQLRNFRTEQFEEHSQHERFVDSLIRPHISSLSVCDAYLGATDITGHFFYLKKRAVRAIFSLSGRQSCKDLFRGSSILTLPSIYTLETITFVKQSFVKLRFFITTDYSIRNENSLTIPKQTTSFITLIFNGVKIYKSLSLSFKLESIINKFKRMVRNLLIGLTA